MHEMSILSSVMDVVLKYAQENNARKVVSVTLVVGELRDVVDELMESCFQFLCRNTIVKTPRFSWRKSRSKPSATSADWCFPPT